MKSRAPTIIAYLNNLPEDRRALIEAVRDVILRNKDPDIDEGMLYGMISYHVPHRVYVKGYHCDPSQPLPFAGLASHKGYISLYLMALYGDPDLVKWFESEWKKTGKKLNMGKSCIRFKTLEEIPLELIGEAFRKVTALLYIDQYERHTVGMKGQQATYRDPKPKKTKAVKK